MRLLTTAGAHAGEVRDYSFIAGMGAIRAGTAKRIVLEVPAPLEPVGRVIAMTGPSASPRSVVKGTTDSKRPAKAGRG